MKRILPRPDDVLEPREILYRSGGGAVAVLGALFASGGVGLFVVLAGFGLDVFAVLAGAALMLVGLVMMAGQSTLHVDLEAGVYTRRVACLVTLYNRQGDVAEFTHVTLEIEVQQTQNGTVTSFPVRLQRPDKPVTITSPTRESKARPEARFLARMLRLSLVDTTAGVPVVRDPDHVDETLRERFKRLRRVAEPMPEPPEAMLARVRTVEDRIVFDIPPIGFVLRLVRERTRVEASPEGLTVTRRWFIGRNRQHVASAELLDLLIGGEAANGVRRLLGRPIVALSDETRIEFGHQLPDDEKQYILSVLERVVTA